MADDEAGVATPGFADPEVGGTASVARGDGVRLGAAASAVSSIEDYDDDDKTSSLASWALQKRNVPGRKP